VVLRFSLLVVCVVTFVYCLLKLVAICFGECFTLLLKVMVLFDCCGGVLPASVFIVFQSVWVFVLWSQTFSSFSFHMVDL